VLPFSSIAIRITHDARRNYHFDDIRISDLLGGLEIRRERGHRAIGIVHQQPGKIVNVVGVDFRLIPLEVDDNLGIHIGNGLGDAVCAALVVGRSQNALGAECLSGGNDFFVIGGYYHLLQARS
jgi:hypothetical protein